MSSAQLLKAIESKLRRLPDDKLREIADSIDFMLAKGPISPQAHHFSDLCGMLSDEDAQAMRSAIEEACERINSDDGIAASSLSEEAILVSRDQHFQEIDDLSYKVW